MNQSGTGVAGTGTKPPYRPASTTAGGRSGKKNSGPNRKKNVWPKINRVPAFTGRQTEGIMKGKVITYAATDSLSNQYRIFKEYLCTYHSTKGNTELSTDISTLRQSIKSDFVSAMPDPNLYSTVVPDPLGGHRIQIDDPIMEIQLKAEWNRDSKIECTAWAKFERESKGTYGMVIGQLDDPVLTTLRRNVDFRTWESNCDLIALLIALRAICFKGKSTSVTFECYDNLRVMRDALTHTQGRLDSYAEYGKSVDALYEAVAHGNGKFAFGLQYYQHIFDKDGSLADTFAQYSLLGADDTASVDHDVKELVVSLLILQGSNHDRLQKHLKEIYATGAPDSYPETQDAMVALLTSFARNNGPDRGRVNQAFVAYHDTGPIDEQQDMDLEPSSGQDIQSPIPCAEGGSGDSFGQEARYNDEPAGVPAIRAQVMATAIEAHEQEIEDDYFHRPSAEQDVSSVFRDDEQTATICAHKFTGYASAGTSDGDENEFIMLDSVDHLDRQLNSDFMVTVYHSAFEVCSNSSGTPGPPSIGKVVEFFDAIKHKLKLIGINNTSLLQENIEKGLVNYKLRESHLIPLRTDTTTIMLQQAILTKSRSVVLNDERYNSMLLAIGEDEAPEDFGTQSIRSIAMRLAVKQGKSCPNKWTNKCVRKLDKIGVKFSTGLFCLIHEKRLNPLLERNNLSRFHQITIDGFNAIFEVDGTRDYVASVNDDGSGKSSDFQKGGI
jgi:hypothetical protein